MQDKTARIILSPDFYDQVRLKHILLDTSFFGDSTAYPTVFLEFLERSKENEVTFVTIDPVVAEFTRGAESEGILNLKLETIKKIIDVVMPILPDYLSKYVPQLIKKYKSMGRGVSLTDFLLAATLMHHKHDMLLLTKNPSDFPLYVFSLKCYVVLSLNRALQIYGVYAYES